MDNIFFFLPFEEWLLNIHKDNKNSPIGFWEKMELLDRDEVHCKN